MIANYPTIPYHFPFDIGEIWRYYPVKSKPVVMKNKNIFFETSGVKLEDILTFSTRYQEAMDDIWGEIQRISKAQSSDGVTLKFIRADGTIKPETAIIRNLDSQHKRFEFGNYVDDGDGSKIFTGRTVRLDNVLGEIPVLLEFSYSTIFCFGKNSKPYTEFVSQILHSDFTNHYARLRYQNTDGSISEIDCFIKTINKSNLETIDFRETLITKDGDRGITLKGLTGLSDVHRFVSRNGYLCSVSLSTNQRFSHYDDGEVFGKTG